MISKVFHENTVYFTIGNPIVMECSIRESYSNKISKIFFSNTFSKSSPAKTGEPIAIILGALESRHSQLLNAPKIIQIDL